MTITNSKQLKSLPKVKDLLHISCYVCLDFEKLKEEYDAIEVLISEDEQKLNSLDFEGLYWDLYGWDCDSILILNKDIVEEVKTNE